MKKENTNEIEKYLLITIDKELNDIYYDLLDKDEYEILLSKKTNEEKQDYVLSLIENKNETYFDMKLLFQDINIEKIKILDTYTLFWKG